ncbi:MAG: phosphate starvation-inducible protein PhoH, partial [Lachnospiraceae bacterium]|nr:phosphate starvation-inducible protein PhoH [Lachnospiraceae bacterium]
MADQQYELTIELPASTTQAVFGQYDTYARKIEKAFGVSLLTRDNAVKVTGHPDHVEEAGKVIAQLASLADKGKALDEQSVNYAISLGMEHISFQMTDMDEHVI